MLDQQYLLDAKAQHIYFFSLLCTQVQVQLNLMCEMSVHVISVQWSLYRVLSAGSHLQLLDYMFIYAYNPRGPKNEPCYPTFITLHQLCLLTIWYFSPPYA